MADLVGSVKLTPSQLAFIIEHSDKQLEEGTLSLVGAVYEYPVADGHAYYRVSSTMPLRVVHIDCGDGYELPAPHVRGLERSDIRQCVKQRIALRKLLKEGA